MFCEAEMIDGVLSCRHCHVPFSGQFAISEADLAKIGGRLERIFRPCGLSAARAPRRSAVERPAPTIRRERPRADDAMCVHRGELLRSEQCPTCRGTVAIKVFRCQVHGACELAGKLVGVACCRGCKDFTAPAQPVGASESTRPTPDDPGKPVDPGEPDLGQTAGGGVTTA